MLWSKSLTGGPVSHLLRLKIRFLPICFTVHPSVCLLVGPSSMFPFLHASNSNFTHDPIPTLRFSHASWPMLPFLISTIMQKLIQLTLPLFQQPLLSSVSISLQCATVAHLFAHRAHNLFLLRVKGSNLAYPALFFLSFSPPPLFFFNSLTQAKFSTSYKWTCQE